MSTPSDHGSVEFEVEDEDELVPADDVPGLSDPSWDLVAQLEAAGLTRDEAEEQVRAKRLQLREALRRERGQLRSAATGEQKDRGLETDVPTAEPDEE